MRASLGAGQMVLVGSGEESLDRSDINGPDPRACVVEPRMGSFIPIVLRFDIDPEMVCSSHETVRSKQTIGPSRSVSDGEIHLPVIVRTGLTQAS